MAKFRNLDGQIQQLYNMIMASQQQIDINGTSFNPTEILGR